MIIPIRCMTCGKPVGHLWEKFRDEGKKGKSTKKILDNLGLERYCCRSLFLTHMDIIERIASYKK